MNTCKICQNSLDNKSFVAREMMFGLRDEFEYFECSNCGCLQIKEIPENLSKYYPEKYYSYKIKNISNENFLSAYVRNERLKYCLYEKGLLGMLAAKVGGIPKRIELCKKVGLNPDSEILDIGCGAGHYLLKLRRDGFLNLTGIDPYIEKDIYYNNGVRIYKKEIFELKDSFDFILLDHSYEHMVDPLSVLKEINRLLKPGSHALIRIPIAAYAWRKYGINWVQLDAPRHLFLHTVKSMQILAQKTNLEIKDVIFDSTEFQFLASEEYVKGTPLKSDQFRGDKKKSELPKEELEYFKKKSVELNKEMDGDQASFYLFKE